MGFDGILSAFQPPSGYIWLYLLVSGYLASGVIRVPFPVVPCMAGKSGAPFPALTFLYASGSESAD